MACTRFFFCKTNGLWYYRKRQRIQYNRKEDLNMLFFHRPCLMLTLFILLDSFILLGFSRENWKTFQTRVSFKPVFRSESKAVEFILNIDWRNCPDLNEIFPYIVYKQCVELFAEGCSKC